MLRRDLPERMQETYRKIAAGEAVEDGAAAQQLREFGLVEQRPSDRVWVAHDPRAVTHGLMERAIGDLQRSVEQLRQLPSLEAMSVDFDSNRLYSGPAAEFLTSRTEMNARIGDVAASAATSVLTAQPGRPTDRDPKVVELGARRTIDALQSGLEVRSLYNPLAAVHEQTCRYVEEIFDAGAEVRTLGGVFPRMMIIDDRHLFIDNRLVPSAPPDAGWHVTDRSTVTWAATVFTCLWDRATRWEDLNGESESAPVTTVRQRQILRDLEAGYSVQQAGRRIGLASRTVTKELSLLRDALGMRTLYQVVAWWAQSPDRELH